jgi:hypothetical protein
MHLLVFYEDTPCTVFSPYLWSPPPQRWLLLTQILAGTIIFFSPKYLDGLSPPPIFQLNGQQSSFPRVIWPGLKGDQLNLEPSNQYTKLPIFYDRYKCKKCGHFDVHTNYCEINVHKTDIGTFSCTSLTEQCYKHTPLHVPPSATWQSG